MRAFDERSAERTVDLGWGTAYFHDTLSGIWDLNFVQIEKPVDVEPDEIFAEVERLQADAGLKHRKLVAEDAETGARLAEFVPDGWMANPLVTMARYRAPDRAIDTSIV
jgi:hypothetical protein